MDLPPTGQRIVGRVLAGFAFFALLPPVVLGAMVRSREHAKGGGIVNRALHIENLKSGG